MQRLGGAHEVSSQVKSLQVLWPAVGRLVGLVAGAWPLLALALRRCVHAVMHHQIAERNEMQGCV